MSKVDELIAELCPNGIGFRDLGDVIEIKRGVRVTKKDLLPDGEYPVVSGGIGYMGYINEYNREAETITIAQYGTAGYVKWQTEKFWANDVCFAVVPNLQMVDNRYLYFFLTDKQQYLYDISNRDAVPYSIDRDKILKIKIPVPPLEIQREIVDILDKFTQLEAELTAELTARKLQYEHYRNQLLTFSERGVRWTTLEEVAMYSKDRIVATHLNNENYVGVDNILQNRQGKTTSNYVPTSGNLTRFDDGDVLLGNIRPYLKKIWHADKTGGTNGDVLVIKLTDKRVTPRYLYQVLASDSFFAYEMQTAKGSKMPRGDKVSVMKYPVPVPSIEEQNRIVSILDKFDALTNDISEGLPAEINARRKQYEYYRNKLLTFKELAHA